MPIGLSTGEQYKDESEFTLSQFKVDMVDPEGKFDDSPTPQQEERTLEEKRIPPDVDPGIIVPDEMIRPENMPDEMSAQSKTKSELSWPEEAVLLGLRLAERFEPGGPPTAIKLYNDVIQRGRKEPITEKDFKPEDLNAIADIVRFKAETAGNEGRIDYNDYEEFMKSGRGNPGISLNTLGGFGYKINADGSISIQDTYDFNVNKASEFEGNPFAQIFSLVFDPRGLAAEVGRKILPDTKGKGVPVNITIHPKPVEEELSQNIRQFLEESGIIIPPIINSETSHDPFNIGSSEATDDFGKALGTLLGTGGRESYPTNVARRAFKAAGKVVQTLKDVMDGKIPATEGPGLEAIAEVAGFIGTGGLATAPARTGVGTFGGVLGLAALKNKEGKEALNRAQLMASMWEHPDDIWEKTGWFLDTRDRKWKFEIPDSGATIKATPTTLDSLTLENLKKATKLTDVLDHPLLYRIYPQLKNVSVVLDPNIEPEALASFRSVLNSAEHEAVISIDPKVWRPEHEGTTALLLHEIQHWIQKKELFGRGASYAGGASEAELKAYINAPGEIEARNVESRFLQEAITGERPKVHPRHTEDVERHTLKKDMPDKEGYPKGWSYARNK